MKKQIFLSVVIPCYNEEANLRRGVLNEVYKYLKRQKFSWEVIISDDGSSDNSKSLTHDYLIKLKNFRLLENPHGGKPLALLYGIKKSNGEYTLLTDMDQSTPISELDKLLKFTDTYDVIIGSRGITRKNFPFYRKVGAIVFMGIRRLLILPEIKDTQCGFKLFESDVLKSSFPKLEYFKHDEDRSGWKVSSYDVELLHILKKKGAKVKEVGVMWNDKDESKSKGSPMQKYINESKDMFKQIIRVKLNEIRGFYEK